MPTAGKFSYEAVWDSCARQAFARILPALRANAKIFNGLGIQAPPLARVPQGITDDAPHDARPEIIGIIKPVYSGHHLFARQARILDVRQLMPAAVGQSFGSHRVCSRELLVKFGPW